MVMISAFGGFRAGSPTFVKTQKAAIAMAPEAKVIVIPKRSSVKARISANDTHGTVTPARSPRR